MNSSTTIVLATLAAVVLAGCDPDAPAMSFLDSDCVGTEGPSITAELRAIGPGLEPKMRRAFVDGPSATQEATVNIAAQQLFMVAVSTIDTTDPVGYPGGGAFVRSPMSDFTDEYVAAYDLAYRSRALTVLGVVATPTARVTIDSIANDPQSPFRFQARIIDDELDTSAFYRIK
jgi:hypothetical protein